MHPPNVGGSRRLNRLAHEASPYLQQHATNPVDWYPWGPEALERARREDKPILLSIGYSACHWCHVMERESFDDEAIAASMNEHFVCIKVDREERPDLDQVYQLVVQLMGQGGGWPLTVFLTPEQKPFFGGTYFPPHDKYGRPGFPRVLVALAEAYRDQREEVAAQGNELSAAIAKATDVRALVDATGEGGAPLGPDLLARANTRLGAGFDDEHGGFGRAPKFPNTMALELLLRRGVLEGDELAKGRVRHALDGMRAGGIWDHLGGGFHRYSTDEKWLVPHFEKMLYDNALLMRLYVDGHRAFDDARYADTARAIAAWLDREMTDASGGFYATQDADSEGEEGKFFVWSPDDVREALAGDEEAIAVAMAHFGVTNEGNFQEPGARHDSGKTVLASDMPLANVAQVMGIDETTAVRALERARAGLFRAREQRPKPFRDEKIMASWNALMIGALAEAGAALGDDALIARAQRAFAVLEDRLLVREGEALRVLRHAKDGIVKGPGFLDDVGFVACAAIDLYEVTGEPRYVDVAARVVAGGARHFADRETGRGFFFAPDDGEKLLVRAMDPYDHAQPSGMSMLSLAMLRLEALRGDDASFARKTLEDIAVAALAQPFALSQSLNVLHRVVAGTVDVVIVGPRQDPRVRALARAALRAPLMSRTLAWLDPADDASRAACAALAAGKPLDKAPAAYVCRGQTCSLPVDDPEALTALLAPGIRANRS